MDTGAIFAALRRRRFWVPALFAVTLLVFFLRRGDTLVHPGVWAEDGVVILPSILSTGASSLTQTVGGYLNTTARILDLAAAGISASQYALVGTVLAWLFSAAVVLAIALSPTLLRYRPLCALAVILVPTGPEVFGIPLYSFWWAGLLLLLVALWRTDDRRWILRTVYLVVGGLSSPLIVVILPVLLVRAIVARRNVAEWVTVAVTVAMCGLQAWAVLGAGGQATQFSNLPDPRFLVRFFGDYVAGSWTDSPWVIAATAPVVIGAIIAIAWRVPGSRLPMLIVVVLLVATIAVSLLRAGGTPIDPHTAGPRYFFYPFTLISWLLLLLASAWRRRWPSAVAIGLLSLSLVNAFGGWSGKNDDLQWTAHIRSCAQFDQYALPVHTYGATEAAWRVTLSGETCRSWLQSDLIPAPVAATYPYRFQFVADVPQEVIAKASALGDGEQLTGVSDGPAAGTESLTLEGDSTATLTLERGQGIYLRTEGAFESFSVAVSDDDLYRTDLRPSREWVVLRFDEDRLPETFTVTFSGAGEGTIQIGVMTSGT